MFEFELSSGFPKKIYTTDPCYHFKQYLLVVLFNLIRYLSINYEELLINKSQLNFIKFENITSHIFACHTYL